ncbi:hypothetical protein SISNIDRAFT_483817 [Sistotremastrum niveocremeum HHB9708]|uniref:Uncharacterized protein n=1 Tax=Sistotremastrum niveocremeum HHB9708 TaxID=1314777 RepID=A0A164X389_9AGAM|nr:hypothetical protein SISNIDRAFT_483817 [Sistotremastrum niveocremeum HHB9708]
MSTPLDSVSSPPIPETAAPTSTASPQDAFDTPRFNRLLALMEKQVEVAERQSATIERQEKALGEHGKKLEALVKDAQRDDLPYDEEKGYPWEVVETRQDFSLPSASSPPHPASSPRPRSAASRTPPSTPSPLARRDDDDNNASFVVSTILRPRPTPSALAARHPTLASDSLSSAHDIRDAEEVQEKGEVSKVRYHIFSLPTSTDKNFSPLPISRIHPPHPFPLPHEHALALAITVPRPLSPPLSPPPSLEQPTARTVLSDIA